MDVSSANLLKKRRMKKGRRLKTHFVNRKSNLRGNAVLQTESEKVLMDIEIQLESGTP